MQLRPITTNDLDEVLALHQRSEAFDGIPRLLEMHELETELDGVQTTMETDTMLVEADGQIVGYVYTFHLASDVRLERCFIFGAVDPDRRREGFGSELMTWGMGRAKQLLRSSGSALPKFIRCDHYDFVDGPRHLFGSLGLTPVRYHQQLRQALVTASPVAALDGITVDPWPAPEDNERNEEIRAVKNAAFVDHWGSTPTSPALWNQLMGDEPTRLDLSFVALNGQGDVVGYVVNERFVADDELLGRKEGWIGNLGTLAEYRGRGIASTLIAHSLNAFVDAGLTHACLDVDGDSPTGANRLYQKLGFETQTRTILYELVLDP